MIARLQDLEDEIDLPQQENSVAFAFPAALSSGRDVLMVEDLAIGYETSHPLSRGIQLNIVRGQKICVIGSNGIGKSTLLQTLAGVIPQIAGKYVNGHQVVHAYFAQDQLSVLHPQKTVLDNVLARTALSEKEARSLLGSFLFQGDDVFKPVGVLSGGEKNRVGLAILLSQKANFLLLDEPTNHLDMSSAEILSDALQDYEGTVFCVSHDREFINSFATHIFVMLPGGKYALFEGNLDDYPRLAEVSGFPNILDPSWSLLDSPQQSRGTSEKESRLQQRADAQAQKRERQRLQKKIDDLEAQMSHLGAALRILDEKLENVGSDFVLAQNLGEEQRVVRGRLEEVESDWMESSEQLLSLTTEMEKT
jgi:ATP-binding cassette subfamily F protein 3